MDASKKSINLNLLTKSEIEQFFNQFDVICSDCDGVIWYLESHLIPFSKEFVNTIIDSEKKLYFITNNCKASRNSIHEKCKKFGLKIPKENITTPTHSIAQYLKRINFTKKVYVLGFDEIGQELDKVGIENFGFGPDVLGDSLKDYCESKYRLDEDVGAVVVGVDPHLSLPKILKAVNYLKNPDVLFFSTNSDDRVEFPGFIFPDAGSFVKSIEAASRRKSTVVGKTSPFVCDLLPGSIKNERTLMIGDRIDIDIVFGKNCGMKTLLVESGMSSMKDVKEVERKIEEAGSEDVEELKKMIPDFHAGSLEEIYKIWKM